MSRWQWSWQRGTQRLTYQGLTLMFLIGLVLVLQVVGIAPRRALIAAQEAGLERLASTLAVAQRHPARAAATPEALPPLTKLTANLATLHKLARAEGIALSQVDYQLMQEGSPYWRYRMMSEGNFVYPAVLKMLDRSMAALPNLALDSLNIDRSTADIGQPRVKVSMSLYFAGPAGQGGTP